MAIPDYQTIMLPLLRVAADGEEHRFRDTVEVLAQQFGVTNDERNEMLPSETAPLFDNRVGWARTYLKQAGLISSRKRGLLQITDRGRTLLKTKPSKIDVALLDQFDEFRSFRTRRRNSSPVVSLDDPIPPSSEPEVRSDQTPEDQLASAYRRLRSNLEFELLDQVKSATPAFFERLVIDLIIAMGYGGSREDAARAVGKSGDGGIDGIIKEDRLGLDVIYLQAKRWEGVVGRPEIQKFAGALQGQRANRGIFITTSTYSREAIEFASIIATKIILIGGDELVRLMIDHDVGVSIVGTYQLKKVDADYFEWD